ncbi:hypothetical protein [Cognatiluteimonas profundi]|uniref:hypothetical protein n=1 Tax=Cognatiluteimonas profundi TaxID=2594501 RepID=UPI00131C6CC1|nr:hypothetical protein [Lysobacter profundi]
MRSRVRVVIALGLAAVAIMVVVATWLGGADWRKLLLFAGIVGVAAWGRGQDVRVPSQRPAAGDAITEAAPIGEEHPAP